MIAGNRQVFSVGREIQVGDNRQGLVLRRVLGIDVILCVLRRVVFRALGNPALDHPGLRSAQRLGLLGHGRRLIALGNDRLVEQALFRLAGNNDLLILMRSSEQLAIVNQHDLGGRLGRLVAPLAGFDQDRPHGLVIADRLRRGLLRGRNTETTKSR